MKIECIKSKITDLIGKIDRVTSKNQNLPILSCLLFEVDGNSLFVSATNLDLGVCFEIPVRVFSTGKAAIPTSVLSSFLTQLPNEGNVVFELLESGFLVSTNHAQATIKILPVDDFPTIPKIAEGDSISILVQDFVKGLQSVWYGAAVSSMKPELSSVYVYSIEKELVFVSTDSFRLAEKKIVLKKSIDLSGVLIPFKNVVDMIRIFEGLTGDILLMINKTQISLSLPGFYVVSRVVDGTFPDYQQIIPKESKTNAMLLKQDFVSSLKLSMIFSGSLNQISFKLVPNKKLFELSAESAHVGKNTTRLEAVVKGEELFIAFNHRYVLDCFQSISSDSLSLGFNGPHKPLVIQGVSDKSFIYLVMPMNK